MTLSPKTISTIIIALLNDRRTLSKGLEFWNSGVHQSIARQHVEAISRDLCDNATALAELAEEMAPWLKHSAEWQMITQSEPMFPSKANL